MIGHDDGTYGGYIDFAQREPGPSWTPPSDPLDVGASTSAGADEEDPLEEPMDSTIGAFLGDPNVSLNKFEVHPTDPSKFRFEYEITDSPIGVGGFNISVYRSANGITPNGDALSTYVVTYVVSTDPSALGTYVVDFGINLGSDVQEDYYLLAVIEGIADDPSDNSKVFAGGAFLDASGGVSFHAETSNTADLVKIQTSGGMHQIQRYQGGAYETIYEQEDPFTEVHVRTYGGNDTIEMDSTLDVPLWAFGGSDNDILYGGAGSRGARSPTPSRSSMNSICRSLGRRLRGS